MVVIPFTTFTPHHSLLTTYSLPLPSPRIGPGTLGAGIRYWALPKPTAAGEHMKNHMVRLRVRIRFRKEHELRLISHRDLVRTMERLFRRASLSLSMSEGFHPKPRMSFPSALAVGITGCDEVMELELSEEMTADAVQAALVPHLPPGLSIKSVEVMPPGARKAAVRSVTFEVPVPPLRDDELRRQVARLWDAPSHVVERDEDRGPIDVRSYLDGLTLEGDLLRIRLRVTPLGTARPREVLRALGVEDLESLGFLLSRTAVELEA